MQERDQAIAPRRPLAAGVGQAITASRNTALGSAAARTGVKILAGRGDFGQALAQARPTGGTVRTVVAGDTLTSMVKDHAESQGLTLSNAQAYRWVQQIAQDNKIGNVNRIFPGQHIAMGAVPADVAQANPVAALSTAPTPSVLSLSSASSVSSVSSAPATSEVSPAPEASSGPTPSEAVPPSAPPTATALASRPQATAARTATARHEVLDRTLDRAVAKGFIPPNERGDVRDKILALASEHRFNPDDFARMTLMESDGMNPRATNQRCHGIIQFCGGPDRGAASAGYADNPKAILGLSVYQQLHLVDKYFDDVGLKNKGPAGLDDLYLSVLMPSARGETRVDAPLNVSGMQARYLYEGRDNRAPITRQSILQGLLQNASERLGTASSASQPNASAMPTGKGRLQAMRTAAYDDALPVTRLPTQLR